MKFEFKTGGTWHWVAPLLARFLRAEKRSTNSAFGKCFGDISVTQNCPEWNFMISHLWGPVVHRQKNPPNLAEWAVCASWHLKNGWLLNFILGNFESQKYPQNISQRPNWLIFFSLWAILPERGVVDFTIFFINKIYYIIFTKKTLKIIIGFWNFSECLEQSDQKKVHAYFVRSCSPDCVSNVYVWIFGIFDVFQVGEL